jgi:Sulfotransferase domain
MTRGQGGSVSIEYDDGGVLKTIFTLPPTRSPGTPSVYAFSLPKAGSVLLDSIMRALSAKVDLTYVSIMGEFFELGLAEKNIPSSTSKIFCDTGYCFGGFRAYPKTFKIPNLAASRSILLLRDPRDMLVSHYFSMRSSHADPGKALTTSQKSLPRRDRARAMSVDDYALDLASYYVRQLNRYIDLVEAHRDMFAVFRYEDVIFNKRAWVADICNAFGWDVLERARNRIADKNDIVPRAENEAKHIRQVAPGDGMRKLKPETVDKLNQLFEKQLQYFGYSQPAEMRFPSSSAG